MDKTTQEYIHDELMKIRFLRKICHVPILVFFALAIVMLVLPEWLNDLIRPIFKVFFALAFVSSFLGLFIRQIICPKCKLKFHYSKIGIVYHYNDFTSECMNCGLKLHEKD